jgi:hypothetical protein
MKKESFSEPFFGALKQIQCYNVYCLSANALNLFKKSSDDKFLESGR